MVEIFARGIASALFTSPRAIAVGAWRAAPAFGLAAMSGRPHEKSDEDREPTMNRLMRMKAPGWRGLALASLLAMAPAAHAALGASVTIKTGSPGTIYPGENTILQITLSNSNESEPISSAAFTNSLPGTLPNGLRIAGAATYLCNDGSSAGSLTAALGAQAIELAGGMIPLRAGGTDGSCVIEVPVTAGTSTGNSATYIYTIVAGAVTGNDGVVVTNVGEVNQSINVRELVRPVISKSFGKNTVIIGGAATTLTITVTNPNPVALPDFSITDVFPVLGGQPIIRVAAEPAGISSCTGGTPATFNPVAGASSVSASGGTVAANGSCTMTVAVVANQTNAAYDTGLQANTIERTTQFSNGLGIVPASDATAQIRARSPLAISKVFANPFLSTGQSDSFTITLTNSGDSPLTVTTLDDSPIDGIAGTGLGLVATSGGTTGTTCAGGAVTLLGSGDGIRLTGGVIPANGSCTVTVNFTGTVQIVGQPISYTNSIGQGAVGLTDAGITSQPATAAILVADDLRVLKTASPGSVAPGNPVRYTVTVQNFGINPINSVVATDTFTNDQTYLTGTVNGLNYTPTLSAGCGALTEGSVLNAVNAIFTIATLPARTNINTPGSCTITFFAMSGTGAGNGSVIANQIPAEGVCYNTGANCNGSASQTTTGTVNTSVLSLAKAFNLTSPQPEGTITRMTLTVTNQSANPLTNLALADTLPVAAVGGNQMRVATPPNASSTCGTPTITADANSTSVALSGGTVPGRASTGTGAAGSCFLQVDLIAGAGIYSNTATANATQTFANGATSLVGPISDSEGFTYNSSLAATKSFAPAAVSSGGRSTVTVRLANTGAVALANVSVTDPLPTGMVLANPSNAYTTCAGTTTVTAVPAANSVGLTGAAIAGGSNCDFIFDVVATGTSNWINSIPIGNITADGGIRNQTAVEGTLNYNPPNNPSVIKATNPSTLTFPGQTSQLTITINNGTQAVTNLSLTDYFTADGTAGAAVNGMVIAPTAAASTTCPGGIVNATPGSASVSLAGVSLAGSAVCTVSVNVSSNRIGGVTNFIPIGAIANDQGLSNAGQASTSLATQANIGITKQFTPNVIKPGERSRLRITFLNPTNQPVTGLSVLDTMPTGVTVPAGANPLTTCTGTTVSSPAVNQVQVSGGSIVAAAGSSAASCYAEIDVTAAAQGDYVNTINSGALTATAGGVPVTNSQPTSDTLRVRSPLTIHKAFSGLTLDSAPPALPAGFTNGTDSKPPGASFVMTVRLGNPNNVALTGAAFTDTLPSGLVVATTPNASTTCAGGTVVAAASATEIRLAGATIPSTGFCTVTVNVLSNIPGLYTNTIAAGGVATNEGVTNEEPTRARVEISNPPMVSKQFSPAVIPPNGTSTLTIFLGNDNSTPLTLSSSLVDTLPTAPGNIVVAGTPNVGGTCTVGSVTAVAGSATVTYANGAAIPVGGCAITVDVTGATAGVHTNNIPAGALRTNAGNNQDPANATLAISTLGYVSGKVFRDNNVTPNGTFESGTDTPIAGVSIELRSGATCSGASVVQVGLTNPTTTDAVGNYLFSGLPAGTYSVCEPVQPTGTNNGITTAGGIVEPVTGSGGTPGTASNPTTTSSQIVNIRLTAAGTGEVSGSINNNFAEVVPSSISGTVFLDQNNNGIQNGADAGINGVTVELLNSGNAVISTTTTDSSGNYSFTGLAPGNYAVRQPTQPANTSNGITAAGLVGNGGTSGDATAVGSVPSVIGGTSKITLPPNTASTGNNFAEIANGRSISGKVFLDFDNSGTFNGTDYGLPSQTLNLTGTDVNGNAVTRSITTGADGNYSFVNLPESNGSGYTITQPTQPPGTGNGMTIVGSTGGAATAVGVPISVISGINLAGVNTVSGGNDFAEVAGPTPDLAIAKGHSPSNFAAGSSTGFFTITTSNVGSLPTSGAITMVDTLPAGLTVAETPTGAGWTCLGAVGATAFTCTSNTVIAAGGTGAPITARVAVASGLEGQILINTAVISGGGEPAGLTGNNTATDPVAVATVAGVSGRVWLDADHDRVYAAGPNDTPQSGWRVELLLNGVLVATTTSGADGTYAFYSLAPGSGYRIQFRHPTTNLIWGRAVPNERGSPFTSGTTLGSTDLVSGVRSGANPAGAVVTDGTLSNLMFTSGTTTIEQSLPLDPAGVVYDAVTRQPVSGAVVTITGPGGLVPATHIVGGSSTFTTGTDGRYQFLLNPTAPPGVYTLAITTYPGGYAQLPSVLIPVCTNTLSVAALPAPALVQANNTAPSSASTAHTPSACVGSTGALSSINQGSTQYFASFSITPGTSADVLNNHIPLDPLSATGFVLTKTGDKRLAEVGNSVRYTLEVRLQSSGVLPRVTIRDRLPAGFTLIPGTVRINGVPAANPLGGLGPVLGFNLDLLRGNNNTTSTGPQVIKLEYRVRVGVGAQQGDGINTARAHGCSSATGCLDATSLLPIANSVASNLAQYKVEVTGGVFTDNACLLGKVFVDCNNNHIQDAEELGIPGVRLYFSDGHFLVSDSEGKYSRCGIAPRSHVLAPDPSTLPLGSRLTTSSNRNLGDANSLFIDLKNGELHRADFIEGSCSNRVLEQVKARRTQGEVRSVETEKPAGPALRFLSKPPGAPQQGTDSANQPLVQPRQGDRDAR